MKTRVYRDPVIEVYMRDIDRTLLRENLKLTFEQRAQKLSRALRVVEKLRRAGRHTRFLKTMKTTEDVFKYATERGIAEEEVLTERHGRKVEEVKKNGRDVSTRERT